MSTEGLRGRTAGAYPKSRVVLPQRLKVSAVRPIKRSVSWILIAIAAWLTAAAVFGLFAWALARSAATADREEAKQRRSALERRGGPGDRRTVTRPWARSSPGRRTVDALGRELADAERALKDAQDRLAEFEARRSA